MATRNGQPIDLIWIQFGVAGAAVSQFMDAAQAEFDSDPRTENCVASVTQRQVGGQPKALVKVNAQSNWTSTLPQGLQNQIERVFTGNCVLDKPIRC